MVERLRETARKAITDWRVWAGIVIYKIIEDWALGKINSFLDSRSGWAVEVATILADHLPFITWLIIPVVIVAIIVHAYVESHVPAHLRKLARQCRETADSIYQFLGERDRRTSLVPSDDPAEWQRRMNADFAASHKMMVDFETFVGTVTRLREEAARAGFSDKRLDRSYEHPVNPFGMKDIAAGLVTISEKMTNPSPVSHKVGSEPR